MTPFSLWQRRRASLRRFSALLALAAATSLHAQDAGEVIYIGLTYDGITEWLEPEAIPLEAYSFDPSVGPPVQDLPPTRKPQDKIHPLLGRWLEEGLNGEIVRVIVSLDEDIPIPRFPESRIDEPRDSPANLAALERAQDLVRALEGQRASTYAKHAVTFEHRFGAKVLQTFWIAPGMLLEIPLASLPALSELPEVRYIEPQVSGVLPPQSGSSVATARAQINSDYYFNLGLTAGRIGIVDSGVRSTHVQLSNPSHLGVLRDCVHGVDAACATGPQDPDDDCNHGTSTAAILTANSNSGTDYRGVTAITIDSFKVYDDDDACFLDNAAAIAAIQAAVTQLDKVIVVEVQDTGFSTEGVADGAF